MKRNPGFTLLLAASLLLSLCACGAAPAAPQTTPEPAATAAPTAAPETPEPAPEPTAEAPTAEPSGEAPVTIPEAYAEALTVKTDENGMLVSVYEKKSQEDAAASEYGDYGAGWLFSIGTVSTAKLREMLCWDMSGADVIAEDGEGQYYVFYHPTDVRLYRLDGDYGEETLKLWGELNEWAWSVGRSFAEKNGLTSVSYDNSDPGMALARAAYMDGAIYELRSLDYGAAGPLEPLDVDAAPYVERMIRNGKISYTDEEAPDGEYIVLYFPEDDLRYDFFLGDENLIRRCSGEGEDPQMYRAELPEGESAAAIMQEWIDELAAAHGIA